MASRSSALALVLGIAGVLVAIVILTRPKKTTSSSGSSSSGTSSGTDTSSGTSTNAYGLGGSARLTSSDSPSLILAAFHQTGYFDQLTPTQQKTASSDPAAWLTAHPFLYVTYPAYFHDPNNPALVTIDYPSPSDYTQPGAHGE